MALIRAFTSATSGVRNFQTALDIISNNISNVNTTGYKASRVSFQDAITQTVRSGTASSAIYGGTNPIQVGLGTNIAAVDTDFTQGHMEVSGRNSDLCIEGDGFFIIEQEGAIKYTRDGSFSINPSSYLVTSAGGFVKGWTAVNGAIDNSQPIGRLQIPLGQLSIARATSNITFGGNMDASKISTSTYTYTTNVVFYDSLGVAHTMTVKFQPEVVGPPNQWDYEVVSDGSFTISGVGGANWLPPADNVDAGETLMDDGHIEFDGSGKLIGGGSPQVIFTLANGATTPQTITLDFTGITQLAGSSDVTARDQDGVAMGTLVNFGIGRDGIITGFYTNGLSDVLGQVALASFSNPNGLSKVGKNLFEESTNSGTAQVGVPLTGGRGAVLSGTLEASNVDLAQEFTRLIVTQRAFQANARMFTASDDVLTELVNLVRR